MVGSIIAVWVISFFFIATGGASKLGLTFFNALPWWQWGIIGSLGAILGPSLLRKATGGLKEGVADGTTGFIGNMSSDVFRIIGGIIGFVVYLVFILPMGIAGAWTSLGPLGTFAFKYHTWPVAVVIGLIIAIGILGGGSKETTIKIFKCMIGLIIAGIVLAFVWDVYNGAKIHELDYHSGQYVPKPFDIKLHNESEVWEISGAGKPDVGASFTPDTTVLWGYRIDTLRVNFKPIDLLGRFDTTEVDLAGLGEARPIGELFCYYVKSPGDTVKVVLRNAEKSGRWSFKTTFAVPSGVHDLKPQFSFNTTTAGLKKANGMVLVKLRKTGKLQKDLQGADKGWPWGLIWRMFGALIILAVTAIVGNYISSKFLKTLWWIAGLTILVVWIFYFSAGLQSKNDFYEAGNTVNVPNAKKAVTDVVDHVWHGKTFALEAYKGNICTMDTLEFYDHQLSMDIFQDDSLLVHRLAGDRVDSVLVFYEYLTWAGVDTAVLYKAVETPFVINGQCTGKVWVANPYKNTTLQVLVRKFQPSGGF